ncbi:Cytochrome P450 [Sphingobium faniae]|nr:Cytochrome P450 [Sphingobium faniae]
MTTILSSDIDPQAIARCVFIDGQVDGDRLWHDLEKLQRQAPLFYCPEADLWIATGYAEVRSILAAKGVQVAFADRNDRLTPGWRGHRSRRNMEAWFGHKDGADHMRTRRALNGFFLPSAMRALGAFLDLVIPDIVGNYRARGGGDFLDLVGFELTVRVTDHLLGLSPSDRPDFRALIPRIMKTFDFGLTDAEWQAADEASDEMRAFWNERIGERIADPRGDDILAQIIRSGAFDHDELVVMGENIVAAGSDTTAHSSTNGMALLMRHPEIMDRLRLNPSLAEPFVGEVMRLVSAAPVSGRGTVESSEIGGLTLPKGGIVLAVLGAANRDPAIFDRPHEVDLARPNASKAISFGHGLHICLGQWVVREALLRLYPEMLRQCATIELEGPASEARGLGIRHVSLRLRVK